MKISIYGHSGSFNHGNEAIVRGVCNLLSQHSISLYSFVPEIDRKFDLDKTCSVKQFFGQKYKRYSFTHIGISLLTRLARGKNVWNNYENKYAVKSFLKNVHGIYLLEAGDQYCEGDDLREFYAYINKEITKKGGKTVMLGCTINEDILHRRGVVQDLQRYSLIVARESLTYNALIKNGIEKNILLAPDPAFLMDSEICVLPEIFKNDVVGINAGFLAQGNEQYYELMIRNYIKLIEYIIKKTDLNIALIPHVNWNNKFSDINTLNLLYEEASVKERVEVIVENNAPRQKYIMSKCRFVVALRTHVAIPAIAAQVPTLVTGYKVKSTGIINDIFTDDMRILAHVHSLKTESEYVDKFRWLMDNEKQIRNYMKDNIPVYINKTKQIKLAIESLGNSNG